MLRDWPNWFLADIAEKRVLHCDIAPDRIGRVSAQTTEFRERYQLSLLIHDYHPYLYEARSRQLLASASEGDPLALVILRCVASDRNSWVRGPTALGSIQAILSKHDLVGEDPWSDIRWGTSTDPETASIICWIFRYIESTSVERSRKTNRLPPSHVEHPNLDRALAIRHLLSKSDTSWHLAYEDQNPDVAKVLTAVQNRNVSKLARQPLTDLHLADAISRRLSINHRLVFTALSARLQWQIIRQARRILC